MSGLEIAKLEHNVIELAWTVDVVLAMESDTLISAGKFADARYITLIDQQGVAIHNGMTKCHIITEAMLQ